MTFNGEDIWSHLLGKCSILWLLLPSLDPRVCACVVPGVSCLQICVESQGDGDELKGKAEVGTGEQVGRPWI